MGDNALTPGIVKLIKHGGFGLEQRELLWGACIQKQNSHRSESECLRLVEPSLTSKVAQRLTAENYNLALIRKKLRQRAVLGQLMEIGLGVHLRIKTIKAPLLQQSFYRVGASSLGYELRQRTFVRN
jgi:hypothetical protein